MISVNAAHAALKRMLMATLEELGRLRVCFIFGSTAVVTLGCLRLLDVQVSMTRGTFAHLYNFTESDIRGDGTLARVHRFR